MYTIKHNIHGTLAINLYSIQQLLNWFTAADLPKPNNEKMLSELNSNNTFSYAADTITVTKM